MKRKLAHGPVIADDHPMDLNDQLRNFFGTDDMAAVPPAALAGGIERMQVAFGLETDRPRRFALWTLLMMFDAGPDLDIAFPDPADREAARDLLDLMDSDMNGDRSA